MAADHDAERSLIEKAYTEHRAQARHVETSRSSVLTILATVSSALVALTARHGAGAMALPVGIAVLGLGLFGMVFAAKLHEKLRLEMKRADACVALLERLSEDRSLTQAYLNVRSEHASAHPVIGRIKMHVLWAGLAASICLAGLAMIGLAIWS